MRQQTERQDVDEAHRSSSAVKLARLQQQRADLAGCLQTLLDDRVASGALDMGNETDAARVVLVRRVVKTLSLGQRHVTPPKYQTGENSAAQQAAQAE